MSMCKYYNKGPRVDNWLRYILAAYSFLMGLLLVIGNNYTASIAFDAAKRYSNLRLVGVVLMIAGALSVVKWMKVRSTAVVVLFITYVCLASLFITEAYMSGGTGLIGCLNAFLATSLCFVVLDKHIRDGFV